MVGGTKTQNLTRKITQQKGTAISRVLSLGSNLSRPAVADRFKRDTQKREAYTWCPLLRTGFTWLGMLPYPPVGSYPTLSPLPSHYRGLTSDDLLQSNKSFAGLTPCSAMAVYSLLHLPSDHSGHPLDGVLPHMQPGLSSRDKCRQLLPAVP